MVLMAYNLLTEDGTPPTPVKSEPSPENDVAVTIPLKLAFPKIFNSDPEGIEAPVTNSTGPFSPLFVIEFTLILDITPTPMCN